MTPIVDTERARLVVGRVHSAFHARSGILSETSDLVENQIPTGVELLSRDHALFLFFTVANDHGMKSSRLYARAKALFAEQRDLFDPYRIIEDFYGPEDTRLVEQTGKRLGTRFPRETAKTWYMNSVRLIERFDGDPRRLFQSVSEARALMREITAFRGYGPKIGGMLLRALVGLGFADVTGIEQVPVPVDIHDSRIAFFTGIVSVEATNGDSVDYYSYAPEVRRILLQACNSIGLKWPDTDRALWLIGSRGCVERKCTQCPLQDLCAVGMAVLAAKEKEKP
jgi:endonuclease III